MFVQVYSECFSDTVNGNLSDGYGVKGFSCPGE